ncbi:MAG TPA: bifunctional aldolase/short-chain dehydrogenase [Rhizomicrobium sp.]|jgi:rhamnose utilization protein RhaD (predicted bifunctional aldolase and dehydrogenase)/NAD(P)-dependent dehydrogenase (short-subunit alcohol dehydrogenase family)|nr:bifunctional aldolase/short-chain dehydrogenase [Rhizomicrobium sp.]
MQSRYTASEAQKFVSDYAPKGVNADLAVRTYTTRLLGSDPRLVLHGGGNTSVKTSMKDMLGEDVEVICIKGSGWDMGSIEPAGLPAVRLAPLRKLRKLDKLSDEDMVNFQRINLLDSASPNPSVETLLHAFLPHKFVDHTHSTAVLALTDQPDNQALVREVYGDRVAYVPYTIPGFALAKSVADVFDKNPGVEGLVLLQHGIFTVGENAEQAYSRMIEFVSMAEERLGRQRKTIAQGKLPAKIASLPEIAPILRGAVAIEKNALAGSAKRQILDFRTNAAILSYVNGAELSRYSQIGVVTPDHTIRTKNWPLVVPAPEAGKLEVWAGEVREAVDAFVARYHRYFATNNEKSSVKKKELDPLPRVILVPGVGMFGVGASAKDAAIAADIAENAIAVITDAEAVGEYRSISDFDMFEVEYWSLEQAKLGKSNEKSLARQVAVITGGGSGIGAATAKAMAREGAEIAILDRDEDAAKAIAKKIGAAALAVACDVTDPASVRSAFDKVVSRFGGVDIVVSNAGAAWQGAIGQVDDATLRKSFELNFWAHQSVAQHAVRIMLAQGTFGCLLFNTSKQAVNPGKDFGPYGLPKAATLFLVKQYALDHGKDGIRSNAVNADRIRTGLLTDDMVAARSKARGLSETDYMSGNLLKREVTADDVADAFVYLATASKTTAAVITVDGGNIEASLR